VNFRVRSEGKETIFCGDVSHSPLQVARLDISLGYCICLEVAIKSRFECMERAVSREALFLPVHFGVPYSGYAN
jgi:glyoxylase-like metal-dependent hydrolase (beta-lactamase superfamily II)